MPSYTKIQNFYLNKSKVCDVRQNQTFHTKICPSVQIFAGMRLVILFSDDLTLCHWVNGLQTFEVT